MTPDSQNVKSKESNIEKYKIRNCKKTYGQNQPILNSRRQDPDYVRQNTPEKRTSVRRPNLRSQSQTPLTR